MNLVKCIYSDSLECMIALSKNKKCLHYKPHEETYNCRIQTCGRDDLEESFVTDCKCIPVESIKEKKKNEIQRY